MNTIRAHVIFGNSKTKKWQRVHSFVIEEYIAPDWNTKSVNDEALKTKWNAVTLPNGEAIEVSVLVPEHSHQCTVNVRQGLEPVAQLMCDGTPSLVFRTLANAIVNIQVEKALAGSSGF